MNKITTTNNGEYPYMRSVPNTDKYPYVHQVIVLHFNGKMHVAYGTIDENKAVVCLALFNRYEVKTLLDIRNLPQQIKNKLACMLVDF